MSSSALRTTNRIQPYLPLIFIIILFGVLLLLAACSVWGGIDKQGGVLYFLTKWQAGLNREIAGQIKLLRQGFSLELLGAMLLTSFIYGALHAAGPGHGKTIISGWVFSQARSLREIAFVCSTATFFHAFGSVILVGGLHFFLGRYVPSVMNHLNDWLYIAAGILLVLTGMQIFYAFHRSGPSSAMTLTAQIHPLWIAVGIGIVPCPLAAVIFLFCLSAGLVWQGILMIALFALGMGVTLSVVAFTAWTAQRGAVRLGRSLKAGQIIRYLNWLSGLFFIIIGVLLAWPAAGRILFPGH
jgi:nickel/cobalt transporter (NicO) family protein